MIEVVFNNMEKAPQLSVKERKFLNKEQTFMYWKYLVGKNLWTNCYPISLYWICILLLHQDVYFEHKTVYPRSTNTGCHLHLEYRLHIFLEVYFLAFFHLDELADTLALRFLSTFQQTRMSKTMNELHLCWNVWRIRCN